jgi:CBS domain-containing protein
MCLVDASPPWPACGMSLGLRADRRRPGGARPVVVSEDDSVEYAGRLMSEHGVTHIVAVDRVGLATGMLSALDVAGVCASL